MATEMSYQEARRFTEAADTLDWAQQWIDELLTANEGKDDEIDELKKKIESLEDEIYGLKEQLDAK